MSEIFVTFTQNLSNVLPGFIPAAGTEPMLGGRAWFSHVANRRGLKSSQRGWLRNMFCPKTGRKMGTYDDETAIDDRSHSMMYGESEETLSGE